MMNGKVDADVGSDFAPLTGLSEMVIHLLLALASQRLGTLQTRSDRFAASLVSKLRG